MTLNGHFSRPVKTDLYAHIVSIALAPWYGSELYSCYKIECAQTTHRPFHRFGWQRNHSMEYIRKPSCMVHRNAISSDIKRAGLISHVLEEMSSSTAKAISCSSTIPTLRLVRQDLAPEQFHEEDPQSPLTPDLAHRSHLNAGRKRAAI